MPSDARVGHQHLVGRRPLVGPLVVFPHLLCVHARKPREDGQEAAVLEQARVHRVIQHTIALHGVPVCPLAQALLHLRRRAHLHEAASCKL